MLPQVLLVQQLHPSQDELSNAARYIRVNMPSLCHICMYLGDDINLTPTYQTCANPTAHQHQHPIVFPAEYAAYPSAYIRSSSRQRNSPDSKHQRHHEDPGLEVIKLSREVTICNQKSTVGGDLHAMCLCLRARLPIRVHIDRC
jgi:hypothetical protein